jgi:foldase protein PrsA
LRNKKRWQPTLAAAALSMAVLTGCGAGTKADNATSVTSAGPNTVVAKYDTGQLTKGELDKQYNLQVVLPGVESQKTKQSFIKDYIVWYKQVYQDALKQVKPDPKKAQDLANQAIAQLATTSYKSQSDVLNKMKSLGLTKDDLVQFMEQLQVIQDYLMDKSKVTDKAAEAYYSAHPADFTPVSVHHILVKTLAEAQNIEKQLKAGANFEKLADKYSQDPGVTQNHGAYENMPPYQFVPEFAHACETQPIGAIGDPVHTQFGYHIIRVDKRSNKPLPFSQVKSDLVNKLEQEKQKAIYDAAVKRAKIQVVAKASDL